MANTISTVQPALSEPVTDPITIEQYETLVDAGAFDQTLGQIELINGRIVQKIPQGPEHAHPIDILNEWSVESVRRQFFIRVEKPIRIPSRMSSPEPDIAWVTRQNYHDQHPSPDDIHLLIEVSHTSSRFDRTEKLQLYAESKTAEYWQIDIPGRIVTVHQQPQGDLFRQVQSFDAAQTVSPGCLPDAKLSVADLFPAK